MISFKLINYSECTCLEKKYIDISWEFLDRIQESIKYELEQVQDELENVMARVACLRKVLRQAKRRVDEKVFCVSKEIMVEMVNHEACKELFKGKEIDTCSGALLKTSF